MSPWTFWDRIKYQAAFGADQVSLWTFCSRPNVPQGFIRVYCEHLKVPGPVLGAGFLSWMGNEFSKQNLTAYRAQVHFLLLPICSPGQAQEGPCPVVPNGWFGLQPGVLLKVHRTSTLVQGGSCVYMITNSAASLPFWEPSSDPTFLYSNITESSLPQGELLPVIPCLPVPHTTANLHFLVTRPQT